jgi:hypothetical protein
MGKVAQDNILSLFMFSSDPEKLVSLLLRLDWKDGAAKGKGRLIREYNINRFHCERGTNSCLKAAGN